MSDVFELSSLIRPPFVLDEFDIRNLWCR